MFHIPAAQTTAVIALTQIWFYFSMEDETPADISDMSDVDSSGIGISYLEYKVFNDPIHGHSITSSLTSISSGDLADLSGNIARNKRGT